MMPLCILSITSFLIIFLSLFTTIDARRSGFLTGIAEGLFYGMRWQASLMFISVSLLCLSTCGLCYSLWSCFVDCSHRCCEDGDEGVEERGTDNRRNKDADEASIV